MYGPIEERAHDPELLRRFMDEVDQRKAAHRQALEVLKRDCASFFEAKAREHLDRNEATIRGATGQVRARLVHFRNGMVFEHEETAAGSTGRGMTRIERSQLPRSADRRGQPGAAAEEESSSRARRRGTLAIIRRNGLTARYASSQHVMRSAGKPGRRAGSGAHRFSRAVPGPYTERGRYGDIRSERRPRGGLSARPVPAPCGDPHLGTLIGGRDRPWHAGDRAHRGFRFACPGRVRLGVPRRRRRLGSSRLALQDRAPGSRARRGHRTDGTTAGRTRPLHGRRIPRGRIRSIARRWCRQTRLRGLDRALGGVCAAPSLHRESEARPRTPAPESSPPRRRALDRRRGGSGGRDPRSGRGESLCPSDRR